MNILYYDWDEFNGEDCRDAMRRLGHNVEKIRLNLKGYDLTPEIEDAFAKQFARTADGKRFFDLVFSFDFFMNISEVCQKYGMPYISWVFDCPHYPLYSYSINNPVNHIYVFDKSLCEKLRKKGISTVNHMPLAVNDLRLSQYCNELDNETDGKIVYEHDVAFLGSLYDNEFNFYDQIDNLPEALKEYLDMVIAAQEKIFIQDLFSEERVISQDHIDLLRKCIHFENSGKYGLDYDSIILDILRKKVTVNERRHILERMGRQFDTVIYTNPEAQPIENVCNLGIADYNIRMPRIFRRSKINLNITLRCILSGIPLRVVDVLAAGGFLITSYTQEIEEYFENGKDLVIAYTPEDMLEKTAYYLAHDDERKEIAVRGQEKVLRDFSYTKAMERILGQ